MIYFDQAATSFPKPPEVALAMVEAVNVYGANPGRSGHRLSKKASEVIENTRKKLQKMFQNQSPDRVIFSTNATTALNQAIQGISWNKGDRVITTSLEHNSVRRPLERLRSENGVCIDYVSANKGGEEWVEKISAQLKERTKLVIVTHGSNVTGEIIPIGQIGSVLKDHSTLFCVDASQTAGVIPIKMEEMNIDILAFPGHKGLLGPQGVGVLMLQDSLYLRPIHVGGTGVYSETLEQPEEWPMGWESGTLNTPGIAGLLKGIEHVNRIGLASIQEHEQQLAYSCIQGLDHIGGITYVGPHHEEDRLGVVAFHIEGIDGHEIAMILDDHYNIAVRAGLHCSPLAHESSKTIDTGLVRASFGPYNTTKEVNTLLHALAEIKAGLLE